VPRKKDYLFRFAWQMRYFKCILKLGWSEKEKVWFLISFCVSKALLCTSRVAATDFPQREPSWEGLSSWKKELQERGQGRIHMSGRRVDLRLT
jgi:hypothetical protein